MTTIFNTSDTKDIQYISGGDCILSAVRQCGMQESDVTPAILSYCKLRLNLILQNFTNRGVPLFNLENVVVGLGLNQTKYALPQYVYEIFNCMWRRTSPTVYTATGGTDPEYLYSRDWFAYATTTTYFQLQLENPKVDSIGLLFFGNQTVTLTIETSTDGSTWTTLSEYPRQEYLDGIWMWKDYSPSLIVNYIRISCASGETLSLRNAYITDLTSSNEIAMTRLNRDTYFSYPNKNMPMSPISFYFDRQITPDLYIWGQPVDVYDWQLHIVWQTQFQNVDKLSQQLSVPYHYLDAIISELAHRIIFELPKDKIDMQRLPALKEKADNDVSIAETSQQDLDPISIVPNLSSYTR